MDTRPENSEFDELPKEMHDMKIKDEKADSLEDNLKDMEPAVVSGNGAETGQIIVTTGVRNGQQKQTMSYMWSAWLVPVHWSCLSAIKKVLQDRRYKNRDFQIMRTLDHPNVVKLRHCFYSTTEKNEVYLNLVLEYVSETVYSLKALSRMNQHMPNIYVQLYTYQICRALNYMHGVLGVCHRDIKPQNLLVNPHSHQLKLCDFGSANDVGTWRAQHIVHLFSLLPGPRLIFGAAEYTTAIDMCGLLVVLWLSYFWDSLFSLEKVVLISWSKSLSFPKSKLTRGTRYFAEAAPEAVDLVSRLLQYSPTALHAALEACAHPFFDALRNQMLACQMGDLCLPCSTLQLKSSLVHLLNCAPYS
ncbi:hypothetical protein HAX54_023825 [Datura stramonium]|uniref:Protein kinase domain-containing protein n=1 Tax=Datura stramonium TaxID=4076 RepID=A0ABS8UZJ5_DATST|nr:hypothetical protein [Datura stramonium]